MELLNLVESNLCSALKTIFVLSFFSVPTLTDDFNEYCEWESFKPSCPQPNQVLIVTMARYGRMRIGRCVTRNYGHIGCHGDVTSRISRKCSGRTRCEVAVITLHDQLSCPADFKSYLEASYHCVTVAYPPNNSSCSRASILDLKTPGFVSNQVALATGYGSASCPLRISAPAHQRVNFTVVPYSTAATTQHCANSAYDVVITEPTYVVKAVAKAGRHSNGTRRSDDDGGWSDDGIGRLCVGTTKLQYLTATNEAEVRIRENDGVTYLLRYEAFGCAKPLVNSDQHLELLDNQATVVCNLTLETFRLSCVEGRWRGNHGNCSKPSTSYSSAGVLSFDEESFPLSIFLVVSLGVVIGIIAGIIMLMTILTYSRRRQQAKSINRDLYLSDYASLRRQYSSAKSLNGNAMASSIYCPQATWKRNRPLPSPHYADRNNIDCPSIEYPLLSLEKPACVFSTLGAGSYHQQCVDMLRRSTGQMDKSDNVRKQSDCEPTQPCVKCPSCCLDKETQRSSLPPSNI